MKKTSKLCKKKGKYLKGKLFVLQSLPSRECGLKYNKLCHAQAVFRHSPRGSVG